MIDAEAAVIFPVNAAEIPLTAPEVSTLKRLEPDDCRFSSVPDLPPAALTTMAPNRSVFEIQICPPLTTAVCFEPSADIATEYQPSLVAFAVQVFPESVEIQIWPPYTTAVCFVPSADIATEYQFRLVALGIQATPTS